MQCASGEMPRSYVGPDHTKSKPELGRNLLRLSVELFPISAHVAWSD